MDLGELLKTNFVGSIDTRLLILKVIFAVGLIVVGVIFGRIVNIGLKKFFDKIELETKIKKGICDLTRAIIRWSIYTAFFIGGISQLGISTTKTVTNVLVIVPSFVGALIILIVGFGLAYFLRRIINESGAKHISALSESMFYFITYVSSVYALKTVFIPLGEISNSIILVLTASFGIVGAYFIIKRNLEPHA
ncbi:MAG: hypothetical protein KJ905_00840 [Nanoarchaeota archaeon]|nr:hypothetical protein [Nanoarchaeota archaeon]MBU1501305.1 hypothetical protein [Nanoarchaeota archaeon]